jgi:hypothetical protein
MEMLLVTYGSRLTWLFCLLCRKKFYHQIRSLIRLKVNHIYIKDNSYKNQ